MVVTRWSIHGETGTSFVQSPKGKPDREEFMCGVQLSGRFNAAPR